MGLDSSFSSPSFCLIPLLYPSSPSSLYLRTRLVMEQGVRAYPGNVCLLGWEQRGHRGVEMEYGEGQGDQGSKGSKVILLWVREDFPEDGTMQAGP